MFILIKVGTVTNAQRAVRLLKIYGIKAYIQRLEKPKKEDGCGYAVKVKADNTEEILSLLKQNGVTVLGAEAL